MPKLLVLINYIGCVLVALAVFELANDTSFVPPEWQLPYHPHSMLALGVLLVVPIVILAVVNARRGLRLRDATQTDKSADTNST